MKQDKDSKTQETTKKGDFDFYLHHLTSQIKTDGQTKLEIICKFLEFKKYDILNNRIIINLKIKMLEKTQKIQDVIDDRR